MDPQTQLHRQLDHLQEKTLNEAALKLQGHYEDLYGHPVLEHWLTEAVQASVLVEASPAQTISPNQVRSIIHPSKLVELRTGLGSAVLGSGFMLELAGALGRSGVWPDTAINLNPTYVVTGGLLMIVGLGVYPWKRWRETYQAKRASLVDGLSRPKPHGHKTLWRSLMIGGAFLFGSAVTFQVGLAQSMRLMTETLQTYSAQSELIRNTLGDSSNLLDPSSNTCRLYRSEMTSINATPGTDMAQMLRRGLAVRGYEKGCLNANQLFAWVNENHYRAVAWSNPKLMLGFEASIKEKVNSFAGMTQQSWCVVSNEWPRSVEAAQRSDACAGVKETYLDHPVSLKDLGVNVSSGGSRS